MPTWVSLFCRIKLRPSTSASQRKKCTEQVCWLVNINYIQPNASVRRSRQKQWFLPKLVFRNSGSEEFRNTKNKEDFAASRSGVSKLYWKRVSKHQKWGGLGCIHFWWFETLYNRVSKLWYGVSKLYWKRVSNHQKWMQLSPPYFWCFETLPFNSVVTKALPQV